MVNQNDNCASYRGAPGLAPQGAVSPLVQRALRAVARFAVSGTLLSASSLLAVGLSAGSASAAGLDRLSAQCLPEEAYTAIETCPAGPTKFEVNSRHATAFKSAPPPREKKAQKDNLGQKQASEEMSAGQRDLRTTRLQ